MKKKTFLKMVSVILICVLLVSCGTFEEAPVTVNKEMSGRIVVVDFSQFRSSDGRTRDILVFRDTKTGFEFIAVMGAGVVQIDLESCGKGCIREVE